MTDARLSPVRLHRMHETLASHVARGAIPGLVALIWRRGETHVDAIGNDAFGSTVPIAHDVPARNRFASPPTSPSGGGGLVSTADDYLAFCRIL